MKLGVKIAIVLLLFSFLLMGLGFMHKYGVPLKSDMDDYFINHAQKEAATNNVVTSIVFDYRGFDTLGEASVLFTAVLGVVMIFREAGKK